MKIRYISPIKHENIYTLDEKTLVILVNDGYNVFNELEYSLLNSNLKRICTFRMLNGKYTIVEWCTSVRTLDGKEHICTLSKYCEQMSEDESILARYIVDTVLNKQKTSTCWGYT